MLNSDILDYLSKYWVKYPKELEHDYTMPEIERLLGNGVKYYLKDGILILYKETPIQIVILSYFNDMGNLPLGEVKLRLKSHREFVKKFNKPIYSAGMKPLFTRSYLFKKENNLWRWL